MRLWRHVKHWMRKINRKVVKASKFIRTENCKCAPRVTFTLQPIDIYHGCGDCQFRNPETCKWCRK